MTDYSIRTLTGEDIDLYRSMDTGIEDDYVARIFYRLTGGRSEMYGLFTDDRLISTAGYTVFAGRYAMLGRLRSDRRYRGRSFATTLMSHVKEEALAQPHIHWVGGNTEEQNTPARKVLANIGLNQQATLQIAAADDVSRLANGYTPWQQITDGERKRSWLRETFLEAGGVFPYECYYPFPATDALFSHENLNTWRFYENDAGTRYMLTKIDTKDRSYLHVVYPWNDYNDQPGLWETIASAHVQSEQQLQEPLQVWLDIQEADALPAGHPFELRSRWTLYGHMKK
ncbi:GNAT family N-acetyltransferase [Alkalicoccus luteus]|uniref:GNAT family N-acetyltransferase n=1 Tax=Alkalicoccus luteus TaxID=1237094 RepID=A0A969PPY5_9BACI|nr:GNAT family N-acetyltransferase [Alkalicoccus luteus]NJP37410.1 GNAT family N-acetyltransferase [Alkalicoccus luteus]